MDISSIEIADCPQFSNQQQSVQHSFEYQQQQQCQPCQHGNPVGYVCRNEQCLRKDVYLSCVQQCMDNHFSHPQDLIPYKIFHTELQSLKKSYQKNQLILTSKIRQTMNQLLHIKVAICKYIDSEIEIIKKLLNQNHSIPQLKDCIYLIQQYDKNEQYIIFDETEEEKEVNYLIGRSIARLKRNVNQLLKTGMDISECQNLKKTNKKNYEYRIQGSISKILKFLQTAPQHVSLIKIYLNQEQHVFQQDNIDLGKNNRQFSEYILFYSNSVCRRIYKQSYYNLLKALKELHWISQVHLVVWDQFIEKQGKLEMIKQYREKMVNISHFFVEDKLRTVTYEL